MIIQEFEIKDKEIFLELCKDFYNSNSTQRPYDKKIADMTFNRIMDRHENLWGFLLKDKESGDIIGYALITSYWCNEEGGNVIVLDELFISASSRHKGYASLFMQWIEMYYKDKAVSITLEVLTSNQTACDLYKKTGYIPDGFTTYTKRIN